MSQFVNTVVVSPLILAAHYKKNYYKKERAPTQDTDNHGYKLQS